MLVAEMAARKDDCLVDELDARKVVAKVALRVGRTADRLVDTAFELGHQKIVIE